MPALLRQLVCWSALLAIFTLAGCQRGPMPPVDIYFSPKGGATEAIVEALDAAKATVFIQAYSFTSKPITQALIRAKQRGVLVSIILDKSNKMDKHSEADYLLRHGITPLIDAQHEIAHNKIMIIDGQIVFTGSFNFTKQAETSNAENLMAIYDKRVAEQYLGNWHDHEVHSDAYTGQEDNAFNEDPSSHNHAKTRTR